MFLPIHTITTHCLWVPYTYSNSRKLTCKTKITDLICVTLWLKMRKKEKEIKELGLQLYRFPAEFTQGESALLLQSSRFSVHLFQTILWLAFLILVCWLIISVFNVVPNSIADNVSKPKVVMSFLK